MSDLLIEIAEQLANDYPDAGLDADQWMKLIVNGPEYVSKLIVEEYMRGDNNEEAY